MRLQPLLQDLKDTVIGKGRYEVQLEIPRTSTLSSRDIDKILKLSTWTVNPGQEAVGYEGVRSILINRESPIKKGGIELKGLQISGIGHTKFDASKIIQDDTDKTFYPPSQENFMSHVSGTKMSTSYAVGRQVVSTKPKYRALGTYTQPELRDKLTKTMTISKLKLDKIIVPHVEAYGRYLDAELTGKDGNFGFMVFPVPDAKKQRAASEVIDNFSELTKKLVEKFPDASKKVGKTVVPDPRAAVMSYYYVAGAYASAITAGLRELHDKGVAHLQPHFSNFYNVKDKTYLMDWATMVNFGNNKEENIINRTIDIIRPATDYIAIFSNIFPSFPNEPKEKMGRQIKEVILEVYSKNYGKEINFDYLGRRANEALKRDVTEFEVITQWMKDQGLEGFPKYAATQKGKTGRNEPCPCGSGVKYKRCCGKSS